MKSRMVAVLVGALGMGLIVVAAGVAGARPGGGGHARQTHRTPPGSVGLKQLTPGLRKLVAAKGLPGPQGSAGRDGAAGAIGAQGPEGGSVGIILTYASGGGPLTLTREGGTTQESIGPLAFDASCEPEGEDTIRAKVDVTSSEDGVILNGQPLNAGATRTLQEQVVSGGGSEEALTVIRATNEAGTFAVQGVASLLVGLPGGCHFYGTLIEDS